MVFLLRWIESPLHQKFFRNKTGYVLLINSEITCIDKKVKFVTMKKKILMVVSILFGLIFINAGLNSFLHYMPMPEDIPENMKKIMMAFVEIGWLMPLIAIAELAGGILFIITKYRALGAIVIFPVMIGILLTHIINVPKGLPLALVLMAINLWVIIENREKYLPMIR
jgi:putative oxidoreductase